MEALDAVRRLAARNLQLSEVLEIRVRGGNATADVAVARATVHWLPHPATDFRVTVDRIGRPNGPVKFAAGLERNVRRVVRTAYSAR